MLFAVKLFDRREREHVYLTSALNEAEAVQQVLARHNEHEGGNDLASWFAPEAVQLEALQSGDVTLLFHDDYD